MRFPVRRDPDWRRVQPPEHSTEVAGVVIRTFTLAVGDRLRGPQRLLFLSDLHWDGTRPHRLELAGLAQNRWR